MTAQCLRRQVQVGEGLLALSFFAGEGHCYRQKLEDGLRGVFFTFCLTGGYRGRGEITLSNHDCRFLGFFEGKYQGNPEASR